MLHKDMTIETYMSPRSKNEKTSDIPTVWIGVNREQARASCDAVQCPLRPWSEEAKAGGIKCYAHGKTPTMALASIEKKLARDGRIPSMEEQLKKRAVTARFIRIGALGDPGVLPPGWWYKLEQLAKKNGLGILSYSHNWRNRPDLAGHTMASCDSLAEAVEARAMGFRAAVATREVRVGEHGIRLPDGSKAIVCPHMTMKAAGLPAVSCNDCGKCDPSRPGPTIIFVEH